VKHFIDVGLRVTLTRNNNRQKDIQGDSYIIYPTKTVCGWYETWVIRYKMFTCSLQIVRYLNMSHMTKYLYRCWV